MSGHPILILQMQRLGDLILTFPLALWLQRRYPGREILIVAEPDFYRELLPVSPGIVYVPWTGAEALADRRFHLLLNLSHRPEAAALAARLAADETIGPRQASGGITYVSGQWQLYRASLVHNNRYNRFHWADLNALDVVPIDRIRATVWPRPREAPGPRGRVGLFLGASQAEKRPPAAFWIGLVQELGRRGINAVLLGGPAEVGLGAEVASAVTSATLNLCGKLSLRALFEVFEALDLLVTPDTGPMHLAAWSGLRTLDLSMGPVNPWETGPYQPGHAVLQARMSCVGCWSCTHPQPYACRAAFTPRNVAHVVQCLIQNRLAALQRSSLAGLTLFRSARDVDGLYALEAADASSARGAACLLARFWSSFFLARFRCCAQDRVTRTWEELCDQHEQLRTPFLKALSRLSGRLALSLRRPTRRVLEPDFWKCQPPLLRPLSGYVHLSLQNSDYAAVGFRDALAMIEALTASLQ